MRRFSVIGPGRAGGSITHALGDAGWTLTKTFGRGEDVSDAAHGCDVCIIAVPDALIAEVAKSIEPGDATLVHLSGVTPLSALDRHENRAAIHPLVALPDPERGRQALRSAWFGLAGVPNDDVVREMADSLSGRWFPLTDEQRSLYHATAAVASNHVVALLAQVERFADLLELPVEPFLHLAAGAFSDVERDGAAQVLTGPAARGDDSTLAEHRRAIAHVDATGNEVGLYNALCDAARRLAQEQAG